MFFFLTKKYKKNYTEKYKIHLQSYKEKNYKTILLVPGRLLVGSE
jgi:hypothetical protein